MRYVSLFKTTFFLLLISPCFAYQPNQEIILVGGLDAHIEQSRESFEAIYYQMVEKDLFPIAYNNNLIINSTLQPDVQKEGMIVLKLIEFLEKQDDENSALLLEKLNNLYFLELHSFLSRMNLKKDPGASILARCQDLYHCTIAMRYGDQNRDVQERAPFRSALSKLFVMITIVNHSQVHYEERKETLAFVLEGVKREMLSINLTLGVNKIDDETIKTFVTLLEVYAAREPMMESHNVRKIIMAAVVIVSIGLLVWKFVLPHKQEILNKFRQWATELRDYVLEPLGEGVGKGAAKGVVKELNKPENQENFKKMAEDAARAVFHGMAMNNPAGDAPGQAQIPNPDLTVIGQQLARGMVDGMAVAADGNPNANTALVGEQISRGAVHGMATDANGVPNPEIDRISERIGEQISRGAVHGMATDANGAPNPEIDLISERISRNAMHGLATDQQGAANPDVALLSSQLVRGALTEQPHQRANPGGVMNPDIEVARNGVAGRVGYLGNRIVGDPVQPAAPVQNADDQDDVGGGWFGWRAHGLENF